MCSYKKKSVRAGSAERDYKDLSLGKASLETNHVLITAKIRWHNELQTMDPTGTTGRRSSRFTYMNQNTNNHTIHIH